jgi:hypothetical protein
MLLTILQCATVVVCWFGLGLAVMFTVDHRTGYSMGLAVKRRLMVSSMAAILIMILTWPAGLIWYWRSWRQL